MIQQFHQSLKDAFSFKPFNIQSNMSLYSLLKSGKSKAKGWLRKVIRKGDVNEKSRPTHTENLVLLLIGSLFAGYASNSGTLRGHSASICHAFGITFPSLKEKMDQFIKTDYTLIRKKRKDTGKTIFNCENKRKRRFTAYNTYKKRKLSE